MKHTDVVGAVLDLVHPKPMGRERKGAFGSIVQFAMSLVTVDRAGGWGPDRDTPVKRSKRISRSIFIVIAAVVIVASVIVMLGSGVLHGDGRGHLIARSVWCGSGPVRTATVYSSSFSGVVPRADELCGGHALRGLRLISSGSEGNSDTVLAEGLKDGYPPFTPRELGIKGGFYQAWVLTSAVDQYAGMAVFPLPLPLSFADEHPGPAQVFVSTFVFNNRTSPERLLSTPFYNRHGDVGFTQIGLEGADSWLTLQVRSPANGGLTEFVFQRAAGDRWFQIVILGWHVTMSQGLTLASSATA
jgi:hypothetical protein